MIDIGQNLARIKTEVAQAAKNAGRRAEEIRIIGVSKFQPPERIQAARQAGLEDLGHNYVKGLLDQNHQLIEQEENRPTNLPLNWHFVGHLQRNKVKNLLKGLAENPPLIHTLDRLSLAQELNRVAADLAITLTCLIQILPPKDYTAASDRPAAHRSGIAAEDVLDLLKQLAPLPQISVKGLMILPPAETPAQASFEHLLALERDLQREISAIGCERIDLRQRSMGMSGDFKEAIAQGATYIRIGTALFGPRVK